MCLFSKADEDNRCNVWGLPYWGARDEVCNDCRANRTDLPWSDLRRYAGWRATEAMLLETFFLRPMIPHHPLETSQFVWRLFYYLDIMHLSDCKGVDAIIFGSVLARIIRDIRFGATQQSRLDWFNAQLSQWYTDHPGTYRLPKIFLSNLVDAQGAYNLGGQGIKSAATRKASAFFDHLAHTQFSGPADASLRTATTELDRIYTLLDQSPMFMETLASL